MYARVCAETNAILIKEVVGLEFICDSVEFIYIFHATK